MKSYNHMKALVIVTPLQSSLFQTSLSFFFFFGACLLLKQIGQPGQIVYKMSWYHFWLLFIVFPAAYTQITDKYSNDNRPYKFGFNIEGYQHRQEQKDEKGIIKGEYGFITADGYYRVTVYATDENGDFRIISMKNYYVGFPPENPTTTPGSPTTVRQGGEGLSPLEKFRDRKVDGRDGGSTETNLFRKQPIHPPQGISACSNCYVPTTAKPSLSFTSGIARKDSTSAKYSNSLEEEPKEIFNGDQKGRKTFSGSINLNNLPHVPNTSVRSNLKKGKPLQVQSDLSRESDPQLSSGFGVFGNSKTSFFPKTPEKVKSFEKSEIPGSQYFVDSNPQSPNALGRGFFESDIRNPVHGRTVFLPKNSLDNEPNKRTQTGEVRDGLPPGVPLSAIKNLLLYRFNYTVGFHGHHEDGYRNGDKEGDYFFDGRDGVERKVEYLANEFGYQPNITLVNLQENDVRRPKEETEKEYGLKGYEFKWFYRK